MFGKQKELSKKAVPDTQHMHKELSKKGVTLRLLWEEYLQNNPNGYRYTQFCEYYRKYQKSLDVSLRVVHKAGEKMYVDYASQTMHIIDPGTGEIKQVQIFVSALGASDLIFAEATLSQELHNFIGSHTRAFSYYGGVTNIVVCDNLKSGVKKACRYEPEINPTYQDMAKYYGCCVIPAPAKPKDKAKVENAVLQVERWILAPLRNRVFFSLDELNEAIAELLEKLNNKPMAKINKSRRELFEEIEKAALRPLPKNPYEFATFKIARANIDYHIDIDGIFYSLPYKLSRKQVEVRITSRIVEIFYLSERVASHMRVFKKGSFATNNEHRPIAHQE